MFVLFIPEGWSGFRIDLFDHFGDLFHFRGSDVVVEEVLIGDVVGRDDVIIPEGEVLDSHTGQGFCQGGSDGSASDDVDGPVSELIGVEVVPGFI